VSQRKHALSNLELTEEVAEVVIALSWKGSAEAFTAAGFELAVRYHQSEEELRQLESDYPSPRCRVCNANR
jgi:hypothetical protein